MKSVLFLSALVGASAFMGKAPAPRAQTALMAKAGKGGAGVAKAAKASNADAYLRQVEPGSGPLGEWYIRDDPSISQALPWVTRPEIGDGSLVGDVGFDPWGLSKVFDVNWSVRAIRWCALRPRRGLCMHGERPTFPTHALCQTLTPTTQAPQRRAEARPPGDARLPGPRHARARAEPFRLQVRENRSHRPTDGLTRGRSIPSRPACHPHPPTLTHPQQRL